MMTILAVDDNVEDLLLLDRALAGSDIPLSLSFAANGEEAEEYLREATMPKNHPRHPLPDLVCLDLHMPRKDGLQTLAWLKRQPKLKHIPVVILSASEDPAEVKKAYELGAAAYLTKPPNGQAFHDVLSRIAAVGL